MKAKLKDKNPNPFKSLFKRNNLAVSELEFFINWKPLVIIFLKLRTLNISLVILTFLSIFLISCSYSFTGSSVPNHLKTIHIPFCIDRSGSGEPNIADDFTATLIDQFISDNSLSVTDKQKADALLECTINSLPDAPTVIEGGENVSKRRVTINARVIYKDFVLKKTVFDKSFTNFADYTNSGDVRSNKTEAIQVAIDKITEDILLAVVSDW